MAQLEPELIPRRLKEARKACGRDMTQDRVADMLGVHKRTVENDEKAISSHTWERLNAYAKLYNKPVEEFLWGDDATIVKDGVNVRLEAIEATLLQEARSVTAAVEVLAERLERLERRLARPAGRARGAPKAKST